MYTLVDDRWDIARGERGAQNYALLAVLVDPRFKNDAVWVPREIKWQKMDLFTFSQGLSYRGLKRVVLSFHLSVRKFSTFKRTCSQ